MTFGFIAPSLTDIASAHHCLWGRDDLSPAAAAVADRLADVACEVSGEAIDPLSDLAAACDISTERAFQALGELKSAGVITFYELTSPDGERLLVYCGFDVDSDIYYGDDRNPPADWIEPDDWAQEDDYQEPAPPLSDEDYERIEQSRIDMRRSQETDPKRIRIFEKTGFRCFYCIRTPATQIDHMHPRIRGGGNEDDNLIGACMPCNVRKKDRTVEEYRFYLHHRYRVQPGFRIFFFGERERLN